VACKCAPALLTARNELNAVWPLRDKASDGCCGDAAHAARKSDHNPNIEGYARAYDYDEDVTEGLGDRELTGMGLILLGDKRTKYLIYEAQLLYPDGTVKPYTGVNAHRQHLHHSIHDWAVLDTRPWGIARAFKPAAAPPEDDDMPPAPAVVRDSNGIRWWFIRGVDGQLHGRKDGSPTWGPLGGVLTSGPSAVAGPNGRIDVAARGQNGSTWSTTFDGSQWTGWVDLGGKS
jgi:hypothetical protein